MQPTPSHQGIAIIGAGLSGLTLALALSAQSIPTRLYEFRSASYNQGGAVMLSPNALRILDNLDVYKQVVGKGYQFERSVYRNANGDITDTYYFGHEETYGYKGLRLYRQVLIDTMTAMLEERGVPIYFNMKFERIVEESASSVTFAFSDSSSSTASLLIGADGIHSKVRRYIDPTAIPKYTGLAAVTTSVQKSSLRFPSTKSEYIMPVTISAGPGAFVMAPQNPEGTELLAGTQFALEARDRAGWDKFREQKSELLKLLRKRKSEWPEIVQSALEGMQAEKMTTWPFYVVPSLESWVSVGGKIVLMGDAAHAIPPTTGQGVNQAFEDVFTFSLVLGKAISAAESGSPLSVSPRALVAWQKGRQERIHRILDLTRRMNNKRLPVAEQAKLDRDDVWRGRQGDDAVREMDWLFGDDFNEMVDSWLV